MEDFYELLGVSEDAPVDEINGAWRERVHQYHPDVNDDTRANAQFKTLKTAHEVLSDETERAAYDQLGHETYVQERLDGLPTARHPATDDSTGGSRDGSEAGGSDDDTSGSSRSGATGGTRTGRSDSRARGGSDPAGTAGTTGRERAATSGTTRGRTDRTRSQTDATSSPAGRRKRPRRPLAYGWAGVAAASVVYLLGVWAYLGANAAALSTLSEVPPATLPSALVRANDLVAPGTFVLDAAATGSILPVAFAAGAAGLAVGFVAVVASFGRGAAYLYAVGGITPLAALAVGPVVAAPDGVVLALVVVVPAATAGLFLVDVGRELLTGP